MVSLITEHIDIWTAAQTIKNNIGRGSGNGSVNKTQHGIKKLRELILELAMRGKLVPQDPNDKPADVLLEKIAKEKARLVKEGKIKKQKKLSKIIDDEIPFELPKGWKFIRFIELLDFQGGSQPPKSQFLDSLQDGYVQLIQIRDLGPNPQPVFVPQESVTKFCTVDDIMIGRYGASVGKVFWGKNGAYNVALIKLIDKYNAFESAFLFTFMTSPLGQSLFLGISRSAQAGFNKKDIERRVVPVPPHAEQKRIAVKVDELMSICDRLEQQQTENQGTHQTLVETLLINLTSAADQGEFTETWQHIANHFDTLFTTEQSIDQLKQTILQLAISGKLTEGWRKDNMDVEPAIELLARIRCEKGRLIKEKKIKKQEPLPPISESEIPFELPKGWIWCRLGELTELVEYGTSSKTGTSGNVGVFAMGHIQDGKLIHNNFNYLDISNKDLPRLYLKHNDLLFNRTNSWELVGKTAVYKGEENKFTFASYLIRLRFKHCEADFYNYVLNSQYFRKSQIEPQTIKQCGQANFNGTKLKNTIVPLASEKESKIIVLEVEKLFTLCESLKSSLNEAQITQVHLADAIVEQATA